MTSDAKKKNYESSIDHTYRKPKREAKGGRVLLPEVQRATDRATMSAEMGGHTGSKGSKGAICGEVWEEETGRRKVIGERKSGLSNRPEKEEKRGIPRKTEHILLTRSNSRSARRLRRSIPLR